MTTTALMNGVLLNYMLDLPTGVWIDEMERIPSEDESRTPIWRMTLRSEEGSAFVLPDGPVTLAFEQRMVKTPLPVLVGIEPVD